MTAFANSLAIRGTSCDGALHIGHHVETQGAVAHIINQSGVMEHQRGIIIGQRDIIASQCCRMGTDGQAQKVEHGLAVLRMTHHGKCREQG